MILGSFEPRSLKSSTALRRESGSLLSCNAESSVEICAPSDAGLAELAGLPRSSGVDSVDNSARPRAMSDSCERRGAIRMTHAASSDALNTLLLRHFLNRV